jgi:predicted RNA-binding Zn-ribbon protein involved in translation (DUF1610 family)
MIYFGMAIAGKATACAASACGLPYLQQQPGAPSCSATCACVSMARKSFRHASATARNLLILSTTGISSMTNLDSNEIEFQCPSCGNDLKQTIGQLKAEKHMTCPGCGIGINIDTDRLANATEEVQKAIEKSPPEITIKFYR